MAELCRKKSCLLRAKRPERMAFVAMREERICDRHVSVKSVIVRLS